MAFPIEIFGNENKGWVLEGIDPDFKLTFRGQHIAQGMTEDLGSRLGETSTVGKQKPDFQWLGGEKETFSFNTRVYALSSARSVKQEIQLLKSFTRRDSTLRRQPRALFTAGTEIGFTCFVNRVQFLYDELREDGSIRGSVINITLQIIDETVTEAAAQSLQSQIKFAAGQIQAGAALFSQVAKGIINIPGGSLHTIGRKHRVIEGETFESIAQREYGNPLLGDILRRAQPEKEPLVPGDQITLVDRSDIITIAVTQQSVALKNTKENLELRSKFLQLRKRKTKIFI